MITRLIKTARYQRCYLSIFHHLEADMPDKILGLNEDFKADKAINKVNLSVGVYRDNESLPVVLQSVRQAEERIFHRLENHEYLPILGHAGFLKRALEFAYGKESIVLKEQRVAAIQTLSGTGACRLATEFLKSNLFIENLYLPDPSWPNHANILKESRIDRSVYSYYNEKSNRFDFEATVKAIEMAKTSSWFLFHTCAHNPTGYDPTHEEWRQISMLIKKHQHHVLFDCAYQGFASGDAEADAFVIRLFVEDNHHFLLAQSFAKNFGLYGERVGALSVVTESPHERDVINSKLQRLARAMYSNPPLFGARIINEILSDDKLKALWEQECKAMADRIINMRVLLRSKLDELEKSHQLQGPRDWSHITKQIGMFSYLGLTRHQVLELRRVHHIYCTEDSRISLAGINTHNVDYIAKAIHSVIYS